LLYIPIENERERKKKDKLISDTWTRQLCLKGVLKSGSGPNSQRSFLTNYNLQMQMALFEKKTVSWLLFHYKKISLFKYAISILLLNQK